MNILDFTFDPWLTRSVLVKMSGPFLSEQAEMKMNSSELGTRERMVVWLERWAVNEDDVQGPIKDIGVNM